MEIDRNLAVSLIDAFDSEDTAIVLWDKNDNVLYRNKKTSERWIKLKLDFEIGQNFYERLKKINDLNLLSKQELSLRKNNYNREIANSADMPWDLHLGIHSGPLVAGTVGTKTVQFDILGKTVNIAFNICDMSDANQILISSDAWMTARNEIKVKSIGLKRLKSGQDIEMLECV